MGAPTNPYEAATAARTTHLLLLFYMTLFLARSLDGWVAGVTFVAGVIGVVWAFRAAHVSMRPIQVLAKKLPWFDRYPVTCRALADDAVLDDALRATGFEVIELDGAQIDGWNALVAALEQHGEPRKWPSDPRKKVMQMLTELARDRRRHRAIVWRDAAASGAQSPSFVASFVADWSAMAAHMRPGLLVFVDLPDATAHEQEEAA